MATTTTRIGFLEFVFFAGLAGVVGRAVQLQVIQGERWAVAAESTRTRIKQLEARRGTIYDRNGSPLAGWHVHLLIPTQHTCSAVEIRYFAKNFLQLDQLFTHHISCGPGPFPGLLI